MLSGLLWKEELEKREQARWNFAMEKRTNVGIYCLKIWIKLKRHWCTVPLKKLQPYPKISPFLIQRPDAVSTLEYLIHPFLEIIFTTTKYHTFPRFLEFAAQPHSRYGENNRFFLSPSARKHISLNEQMRAAQIFLCYSTWIFDLQPSFQLEVEQSECFQSATYSLIMQKAYAIE